MSPATLIRSVRSVQHAKRREPPRLRLVPTGTRPPRVLYLSPDPEVPRGGVRVFYRHVDVLNAAGIPASIVHVRPGYRADWFDHDTRIEQGPEVAVTTEDVVVVPEFFSSRLDLLPRGPRLVLFNQAPYFTFDAMTWDQARELVSGAAAGHRIESVLTVSEDGARLLQHVFEELPVLLCRSVIDPTVFHPGRPTAEPRPRRIAYATNRRAQQAHQVLSILAARGVLDGWELVPIRGMSERRVAEELRRSPIFLSFSDLDGFGLPPAEAMASGCYVVGFTGRGGDEFFDPAHSAPVRDDDLLGYALAAEDAVLRHEIDPAGIAALGRAASAAILDRYTAVGLRDDLLDVFGGVLR